VTIDLVDDLDSYQPRSDAELSFVVAADGSECRWLYDPAALSDADVVAMDAQFATFLSGIAADAMRPLSAVPILSDLDLRHLVVDLNATARPVPDASASQIFAARAAKSPEAAALVFADQELTYADLDSRANQLAHHLQKLGVGPNMLVGLCLERSLDLVVALLATLKSGGAYVPLDPAYPTERLRFMLEDSRVAVLVSQTSLVERLPESLPQTVYLDRARNEIAQQCSTDVITDHTPDDLAYVIYTSGSTGRPKGVIVRQRNLTNFLAAMDEQIPHDPPGVWLAVTSLSFDISVLELLWTLSHGFKVILWSASSEQHALGAPIEPGVTHKPIDSACSTSRVTKQHTKTDLTHTHSSWRERSSPISMPSRPCGHPSATSMPSEAYTRTPRWPARRLPRSPSGSTSGREAACFPSTTQFGWLKSGHWSTISRMGG